MMDSPFFSEIRIDEQMRCHLLRDEIGEWLDGPRDPKEANRIWSEVVAFKNYLAEVNHRSELVAFDRRMIEWALAEVKRRGMTEEVPTAPRKPPTASCRSSAGCSTNPKTCPVKPGWHNCETRSR